MHTQRIHKTHNAHTHTGALGAFALELPEDIPERARREALAAAEAVKKAAARGRDDGFGGSGSAGEEGRGRGEEGVDIRDVWGIARDGGAAGDGGDEEFEEEGALHGHGAGGR